MINTNPEIPKNENDVYQEKLQSLVTEIRETELLDSVLIICTKTTQDRTTIRINADSGNTYASIGAVKEWLKWHELQYND